MRQHVTQPGFEVDTVQLGPADQRIDRGGALAASFGAGKQIVAASNGHATQGVFGCGVINLHGAVFDIAQQCRPQFERVQDRRRRVDLRESVARSQRSRSSSSGRERACRTWRRSSGGLPRISASIT